MLLFYYKQLKDSVTRLRMDKNDSIGKIISFYPHRSIFLALFDEIFMFFFFKHALAVSHLRVTLQMMSNNRRSFSSIGLVTV
jgi:hypothetical protein